MYIKLFNDFNIIRINSTNNINYNGVFHDLWNQMLELVQMWTELCLENQMYPVVIDIILFHIRNCHSEFAYCIYRHQNCKRNPIEKVPCGLFERRSRYPSSRNPLHHDENSCCNLITRAKFYLNAISK